MIVTKYYCDLCGCEIEEVSKRAMVYLKAKYHMDSSFSNEYIMCCDCWIKLKNDLSDKTNLVKKDFENK